MSNKCCICGKTNRKLWSFPTEPKLREIWCLNIKKDLRTLNTRSRLCTAHFDDKYIGQRRAILGAIPTINLGHSDLKNVRHEYKFLRYEHRSCCIRECRIECKKACEKIKTFPFPKGEMRQLWITLCNLDQYERETKKLYLCVKHFESKYINPYGRLIMNAIPTLKLRQPGVVPKYFAIGVSVSKDLKEAKGKEDKANREDEENETAIPELNVDDFLVLE